MVSYLQVTWRHRQSSKHSYLAPSKSSCEMLLLDWSCLSVYLHGTVRLRSEEFSLHSTFCSFINLCQPSGFAWNRTTITGSSHEDLRTFMVSHRDWTEYIRQCTLWDTSWRYENNNQAMTVVNVAVRLYVYYGRYYRSEKASYVWSVKFKKAHTKYVFIDLLEGGTHSKPMTLIG